MKNKITKIMGAVLALVLISSMVAFALPTSADPYSPLAPQANKWASSVPTAGALGGWFYDATITKVGPIAEAINGDLYAYVTIGGVQEIAKSTTGGRSWTLSTHPARYDVVSGVPAVAIVCSALSEDVVYVTDGNYVFKSLNGGVSWAIIGKTSQETAMGTPAAPVNDTPITCLDVGYLSNGDPFIFIGAKNTVDCPNGPSVFYFPEAAYASSWNDLLLGAYRGPAGAYVPYSVGCAPDFATSKKTYVLVSKALNKTYVISTVGIVSDWNEVAELKWNCATSFVATSASRFAFPDNFASTYNLYIGVASGAVVGGDVYTMADDLNPATGAYDLNVNPGYGGCTGLHANICSLDMKGNNALIAGSLDAQQTGTSPVGVYYSSNAGGTWGLSAKYPTGTNTTYVLFYGDSAVAATNSTDCAFSLSCGATVGAYWNQISLISMTIHSVLDMSFGPSYATGIKTMFAITEDGGTPTTSTLRYDGTFWERVYCSRYYSIPAVAFVDDGTSEYQWVEVSPDFDDTGCVYMANASFYMTKSTNAGCAWQALAYQCTPITISAWIVVDENTVFAAGRAGTAGTIYRTITAGSTPWSEFAALDCAGAVAGNGVDFDISPNVVNDNDVLFGDDKGQVFLSTDLGATWGEIQDPLEAGSTIFAQGQTYVAFDPEYDGTADAPGFVYAAVGHDIGRCNINPALATCLQDLEEMYTGLANATGIDKQGDPVLYVSDEGGTSGAAVVVQLAAAGTIQVKGDSSGLFATLSIAATTVTPTFGTFTSGEPALIIGESLVYTLAGTTIAGALQVQGAWSGAIGNATLTATPAYAAGTNNETVSVFSAALTITVSGAGTTTIATGVVRTLNPHDPVVPTNYVVFERLTSTPSPTSLIHPAVCGVNSDDLWLTTGSNDLWSLDDGNVTYIWMWSDPLATPVLLVSPADGAILVTDTTATLEWTALDAATGYEVYLYSYCPTCPTHMAMVSGFPKTTGIADGTCLPVTGLTAGTTYYWKVRVASGHPYLSKWSELRSFQTALGFTDKLCSPACGADDIIPTTNFSWNAVPFATGYELQVVVASADGTADFTGATTYTSDVNALASIPGLQYSTVYFWRVRAVQDGVTGAWVTCLFTIMDAPEECPPAITPVTIVTEEVTPMWIWFIIGIGGALTIVVIILIVTTRRAS